MLPSALLTTLLCVTMLLPYLPGGFDASAATFSFMVQVAAYVSLLLVPVGLAWLVGGRRVTFWHRIAMVLVGLLTVAMILAGAAQNQLATGVVVGVGTFFLLRRVIRPARAVVNDTGDARRAVPIALVCVPLILVAFRNTVLPRAAAWSRDRAIQHRAVLIAQIEAFYERRGDYPVSLRSLNRDFPTGVRGIERFEYEPNGQAYNLFFIRPHIEVDAMEVVLYNPRDEHRFTSHELDILQYDGEDLDRRRGDRRRTPLAQPHWISILFD